ncbi:MULTISPECIES: transposase [Enterococcus]|uniref:transposase n=1 Tax=Enterococcus TaxID=1350 RepID=UPI00288D7919|nr:transposase [Enterococcus avium]MDT2427148.1 transposase [Enterococcus avium]
MTRPYSNGTLETANNHIKVLKRMAYGFRNFINFKLKIFLYRGKYCRKEPPKQNQNHPCEWVVLILLLNFLLFPF